MEEAARGVTCTGGGWAGFNSGARGVVSRHGEDAERLLLLGHVVERFGGI